MARREQVKPITYMKTRAAELLATVSETRCPMIITHNGEAKMVVQDIESFQSMKDTLALLKVAALGRKAVEQGRFRPAREAFDSIERGMKRRRG